MLSLTAALVGVQRALYGIDLSYLTMHRYQVTLLRLPQGSNHEEKSSSSLFPFCS